MLAVCEYHTWTASIMVPARLEARGSRNVNYLFKTSGSACSAGPGHVGPGRKPGGNSVLKGTASLRKAACAKKKFSYVQLVLGGAGLI